LIKDLNERPETLKVLKGNIGRTLEDTGTGNNFLIRIPISQEIIARQMGLHQIKKLLFSKGNSYQSEEAVYRMGENLCKLFIHQGISIQTI
jgi:hypothetical protein